jgi:hypothetical protein
MKGVLEQRQKVFVPVNKTSFAFVSCRRCVSHAPSYRAERWFGFSFVIVGSGGRRRGSTTGRDGASSLWVSFRGVICPKSGSFCCIPLRECMALVQAQDAHGGVSKRCEDAGDQGVQTRAIKV